jgi:hypothetical protein
MKTLALISQIIFLIFLLSQFGCEQTQSVAESPSKAESGQGRTEAAFCTPYAPVKIDIMPLTDFVKLSKADQTPAIDVYVSLLDSFGSQCKSPGTFRFEMYEYVQLSSEPMGKRIVIWPDIDLTDVVENNKYWRDFLRCYKFNLPFEQAGNQSYILQVTFLSPTGKRLSDEFIFKRAQ